MAMHTAKPAPKAAKPQAVSSNARGSAESRPNSGSTPHALPARPATPVTAESRRAMIAEAAYYLAEQRGFASGRDQEDWLLAEKRIDDALSG